MRNHWIRNTWKLTIKETKPHEWVGKGVKFCYGPYTSILDEIECIKDLRDICNIDAGLEIASIVIGDLSYQYGLRSTHQWCELSYKEKFRVVELVKLARKGQSYSHLLD